MLPRSCVRWAGSKANSSTRLPRTTTTRVSSGWVASINILLGILELLTAAGAVHGARKLRRPVTRRSTCFGGEGKAKTQISAPRRTGAHWNEATCEAFGSPHRGCSVDLGRQHSLAHQASARLNMLAARDTAASIRGKPGAAPKR